MTFDHLFGLEPIMTYLTEQVILPFRHRGLLKQFKIELPKGLLLHGPTGCGKTSVAIALIRELGIPAIFLSSSDVHQKVLGQGERNVQDAFRRARRCQPCALVLDNVFNLSLSLPRFFSW